jgi:hypothetical protein
MFDIWLSDIPWLSLFPFYSFCPHPEHSYFDIGVGIRPQIADTLFFCRVGLLVQNVSGSRIYCPGSREIAPPRWMESTDSPFQIPMTEDHLDGTEHRSVHRLDSVRVSSVNKPQFNPGVLGQSSHFVRSMDGVAIKNELDSFFPFVSFNSPGVIPETRG